MSNPTTSLPPGFRFHPTDEELILHYLRNRVASLPCPVSIIAEVDIYKFDPWDLPVKATFGDREWYFFSPRDRKYPNGIRPNRAAASGYWKATGTDKPVVSKEGNENIGVKKALVFYKGRPPKGVKTGWIMHEYRLAEALNNNSSSRPMKLRDSSMRLDDWVLCRIYKKNNYTLSMEPEQGDSAMEDVLMPSLTNTTPQDDPPKLPKSCSFTELLNNVDFSSISQLLETPPDMLSLEQVPIIYPNSNQILDDNISSDADNHLFQQLSQTESPVFPAEGSLKRQWTVDSCLEDGSELPRPSKKIINSSIFTSFINQFDIPANNLSSNPFSNQQLLSNSHLKMQ